MSLFELPDNIVTRWASAENRDAKPGEGGKDSLGRKGSPATCIKAGECLTMAHGEGSGIIRRIWLTISDRNPEQLRGFVIRMYWDGCKKPAVEAPLGDFFCMPLGKAVRFQSEWFDNPEGRSFNCRIPMPFRKGFKITLTNESGKDLRLCFYEVDFTLGDNHSPNVGYFHAHYRRERHTTLRKDFEILPHVAGKGRFLGCNLGVIADKKKYANSWWGEGEAKIYLDGDTDYPTLCGTGTEDYPGSGWGFGVYSHQWYGCPLADKERYWYGFYRLHGPDPVYFHQDIRVTMQQIGCAWKGALLELMKSNGIPEVMLAGKNCNSKLSVKDVLSKDEIVYFERSDDWCATAYFYLDKPENSLPPIEPYEARIAGLIEGEKPATKGDVIVHEP